VSELGSPSKAHSGRPAVNLKVRLGKRNSRTDHTEGPYRDHTCFTSTFCRHTIATHRGK